MLRPKGFTLIELLVVIAIIGVLSTIVMVSLTSARAKARDSKRLSDLGQMSKLLNLNSATKINFGGSGGVSCTTVVPNGYVRVNGCTSTANGIGAEFAKFRDPSGVQTAAACLGASNAAPTTAGPCNYSVSISTVPNTQDYQICAWLETDVGPLKGSGGAAGGLIHITENSLTPIAGCP